MKRRIPPARPAPPAPAVAPPFAQLMDLGVGALQANQPERAAQLFARAVALQPGSSLAHCNLAVAQQLADHYDEALASYAQAVAVGPNSFEAHCNRGVALTQVGQLANALASFERALVLRPDSPPAHYNKALALLLQGELAPGWLEYEWRHHRANGGRAGLRDFAQPLWLGQQPLQGRTILLHAEQGLGDTLQFCRYAPLVAQLGAQVTLEVDAPLVKLMRGLPDVYAVHPPVAPGPVWDFHCPLLSLPLAFRTTLATVPAMQRYLAADSDKITAWQARLGPKTRPRIGLAWSGGRAHYRDRHRSIPLALLASHLQGQFEYISLQKDVRESDQHALEAAGIFNVATQLHDFSDTAALCECMDLVISVDTSVAHLSAALGRPTFILLPFYPDWRWMFGRTDSPWYPTVTLYRQGELGTWTPVVAEAIAAAHALLCG
jgi:Tfp pilus assembly protein PilF